MSWADSAAASWWTNGQISSLKTQQKLRGGNHSAYRSTLPLASSRYGSFQLGERTPPPSPPRASFGKKIATIREEGKTQLGSFQKDDHPLTNRPTPALSPTPLHCWGKPPSSSLVSGGTGQTPAAAPPVVVGSSWRLRRSAVVTCWQSAPRLRTGCRLTETSRPAKSSSPAQGINSRTNVDPPRQQTLPYKREPAKLWCLGTPWAAQPELLPLWYWGSFQTRADQLLLQQDTQSVVGATLWAPGEREKQQETGRSTVLQVKHLITQLGRQWSWAVWNV